MPRRAAALASSPPLSASSPLLIIADRSGAPLAGALFLRVIHQRFGNPFSQIAASSPSSMARLYRPDLLAVQLLENAGGKERAAWCTDAFTWFMRQPRASSLKPIQPPRLDKVGMLTATAVLLVIQSDDDRRHLAAPVNAACLIAGLVPALSPILVVEILPAHATPPMRGNRPSSYGRSVRQSAGKWRSPQSPLIVSPSPWRHARRLPRALLGMRALLLPSIPLRLHALFLRI